MSTLIADAKVGQVPADMKCREQDSTSRRYRITKTGAKHARFEKVKGAPQCVVYGGPDGSRNPQIKQEIVCTRAEFLKLKDRLQLVEVADRDRVEVKGEVEPVMTKAEVKGVHVPKEWQKLSVKEKLELAGALKGKKVTKLDRAEKIIADAAGAI